MNSSTIFTNKVICIPSPLASHSLANTAAHTLCVTLSPSYALQLIISQCDELTVRAAINTVSIRVIIIKSLAKNFKPITQQRVPNRTRGRTSLDRVHNSRRRHSRPWDLDLWPYINWLIKYWYWLWARYHDGPYLCAKFSDFSFSHFGFIVPNTHTESQTSLNV